MTSRRSSKSHRSGAGDRRKGHAQHAASTSDSEGDRAQAITLDDCIARLSRRIGHSGDLTTKMHESGVRILTNIRDRIMRGEQAGAACNVLLVCCGVSVERRRLLTPERDEARNDYLRTAVLIFVTICLIEHQRRGELEDEEADMHIETLQRAASASLWRRIRPEKTEEEKKKDEAMRLATPVVAALDPSASASSSLARPWSEVIEEAEEEKANAPPPKDGDVAFSAMCSGVMLLGTDNIGTFEQLSEIFYRHTALQLASSSLKRAGTADFLSLSAFSFCGSVNTDGVSPAKLKALIAAGESEAGQQVTLPTRNPFAHDSPHTFCACNHR